MKNKLYIFTTLLLLSACGGSNDSNDTQFYKKQETIPEKLEVSIDLDAMTVTAGDLSFPVDMPASARQALLAGKYDPIKELLDNNDKIEATAASLSYVG